MNMIRIIIIFLILALIVGLLFAKLIVPLYRSWRQGEEQRKKELADVEASLKKNKF